MKMPLALALLLSASACGEFPRDPDGTLDRIRSEGRFNVGLVAPLTAKGGPHEAFLDRLGNKTSARPAFTTGDSEPLLKKLEEGELDLVIGHFDKKSPWSTMVEIGPALHSEKQGKATIELTPVMPVGENAWIALVEAEARNAGGEGR